MMDNQNLAFTDDSIKLVEVVADRPISNTQSPSRRSLSRRMGSAIYRYKNGGERAKENPWREGKGFHFEPEEVKGAIEALKKASDALT
ncbi:hypothetical protein NLX71_18300 [Paenibacillus sp. MZ04-78.2]|uniref:hypothetical protein n=1 Tax=Paenibacillus sp. MZ04-78.2 TaxID=2962034 RepID=UPI0020B8E92F|nr:hypothetical protein [Paenibacillus sp. MZ04-78.2]MCP3775226.1 hypothetical protein [Paenibacillus sp. MZ04-78.2]